MIQTGIKSFALVSSFHIIILLKARPLRFLEAVSLTRKWEKACNEVGPAIQAFQELTGSTPSDKVQQWQKAAEHAQRERHTNYEVMDIYNVQSQRRKYIDTPGLCYEN